MKHLKRTLALLVTAAMLFSLVGTALADDVTQTESTEYTYDYPTEAMEVDDNIITASAHRAASPILGIMGVNATSGFGMIQGSAPDSLSSAIGVPALAVWSTLNENPDPYYWNYFYNFYAEEYGLETSDDALINLAAAASPVAADTTLYEEYGNISVSLYSRPDLLVGCASSNSGSDTSGYDSQLATIASFYSYDEDGNLVIESEYYQEGDENYDPKLVSYQTTTIENMIDSMYALADAITEIEEETGKTTRYGDVQVIASDYETYIYGIIAYVQAELDELGLEQKTFAFITDVLDDGTFEVGGADYNSATSLGRAYEYGIAAATPLTTETTTMTLDEVLEADVIITINNSTDLDADTMAEAGISEATYDGILITNIPNSLYGLTQNSVENALGYAYIIGSMYSDILDIDPVELCAYFYENFEHVTDRDNLEKLVLTNFADTILPAGVSSTLSEDYSSEKIEAMLVEGMDYYTANESLFDADQFLDSGIDEWVPDYSKGIGSGIDYDDDDTGSSTTEDFTGAEGTCGDSLTWTLSADGVLTISGTGAMTSYSTYAETGWYAYKEYITSVVIEDGVTNIAPYAFMLCENLTAVSIPDSVTSIGNYAFYGTALTSITLPGSLTRIGTAAFFNCSGLTSIDIPDSVTSIGSRAFYGCSGLADEDGYVILNGILYCYCGEETEITLPDSVTSIDARAFEGAYDVTSITIPGDLPAVSATAFTGLTATVYYTDGNETYTAETKLDYGGTIAWRVSELAFTDVEETSYYYECVLWAYSEGITTGATTTSFDTDSVCTRAQAVTFLYRAAGEPDVSDVENPFTDVSEDAYYYEAVLWAYTNGITTGATTTTFNPSGECTREQIVTFLYRYAGEPETTTTISFTDVSESSIYYSAIAWAYGEGVATGYSDTVFGMGDGCTRAQIVTFLYRAIA